jgi:hypothetical protein
LHFFIVNAQSRRFTLGVFLCEWPVERFIFAEGRAEATASQPKNGILVSGLVNWLQDLNWGSSE